MKLNSAEGGSRPFILVQLPEICGDENAPGRAAFKSIAGLGKERIRRAAMKIKKGPESLALKMLDVGFRVLKIERSNIEEMCYPPMPCRKTCWPSGSRCALCSAMRALPATA